MFSFRRALAISAVVLCALGIAFLLARVVGGEQRVWSLAGNTLLLATHTCLVSLPIGTLLAFLIVRTDLPGRRFVAVAVGAMLFIPLYIQAAAWDAGFGQLGWYSMAGGTMAKPILSGWWAVVWIHGMTAVPWVVLIVGAGLRLVEPELEEEALLFGSHWQVFRHVTLVRMMAYVGVAALWILISTTCEMTVTNLYRVPTLTEIVYMELPYVDSLGEAGLTTLPLTLVVGSLAVVSLVIVAAVAPPASSASMRPPRTIRLGALRAWATVVVCALLLLVVVAPLGNLVYKAGFVGRLVDGQPVQYWSFSKFIQIVMESPVRFRFEFAWTLAIGATAATTAVCVALPLAWWARQGGIRSTPAFLATALCLAIPGPLVGIGLISLFSNQPWGFITFLYDRTIIAPVLAVLVRALPVAILLCWYGLRTVAPETLESAATEGVGGWSRFWRIAVPQRWSVLAAAWLAALAISMGDVATSILVIPPGVDTVPRRVFGLIHGGVEDWVAAVCLVNVVLFALAAVFVMRLVQRTRSAPTRETSQRSLA